MKFIHGIVRVICYILTPSFYRAVFRGQMRVAVYLSSGQTVRFNCTHWKVNLHSGEKKYELEGLTDTVGFDPAEIVGIKELSWW